MSFAIPMNVSLVTRSIPGAAWALTLVVTGLAEDKAASSIRHSYLVMGAKTAIIGEDGQARWEYRGGTRDGFVLPNGNALLAWSDRVEEVTPAKQVVFSYTRNPDNAEIGTVQRLYNGNTLVTELGKRPRLLEVDGRGTIVPAWPVS